jgi:hypothetical protein
VRKLFEDASYLFRQFFQLHRDASRSGKKEWKSVLPPMESILKAIKCFCSKCKYIFFFKENPVFLGQQGRFRAFVLAGDI